MKSHSKYFSRARRVSAQVFVAILLNGTVNAMAGPVSAMNAEVRTNVANAEAKNPPRSIELLKDLYALATSLEERKEVDQAIAVAYRIVQIEESMDRVSDVRLSRALIHISELYRQQERDADAFEMRFRASVIQERSATVDRRALGINLAGIGALQAQLGHDEEAVPLLERALGILDGLDTDQEDVPYLLSTMIEVYERTSRPEAAIPLFMRRLAIVEKTSGSESEATAMYLNQFALYYQERLQQPVRALPLFERSRAIFAARQGPESGGVAMALSNISNALMTLGKYGMAVEAGERALAIKRKVYAANSSLLAMGASNLGATYVVMGKHDKALPLLEEALAIDQAVFEPNSEEVARDLSNLGHLLVGMEDYDRATPLLERSVAIRSGHAETAQGPLSIGLMNLASAYRATGRLDEARRLYLRGLSIREAAPGDRRGSIASTLFQLAMLSKAQGDFGEAARYLERSIDTLGSFEGQPELRWALLANIATLQLATGNRDLAIFWNKQAVNLLQGLRSGLTSSEASLQSSYIKNRTWPYTQLADMLISEGRLYEAQQVLAMLKERELYDEILRGEGGPAGSLQVDLNGVERAKFAEYYRIRDQQVALADERRQLQGKPDGERSPADRKRLDTITQQLFPAVKQAMDSFMAGLQRELNQSSRKQGETETDLWKTQAGIREAVEALADPSGEPAARAVALQYVMTDKRLSIILTVPGGPPVARQVNVDYGELAHRINQFVSDLKQTDSKTPIEGEKGLNAQARALFRILIEPVLPDMKKARARTVMLSLTDVLRFMPFAALYDGEHYLVQDYTLALYNEASTKMAVNGRAKWRVAAFGLSEAVDGMSALPEVPQELELVTNQSIGAERSLNAKFSRRRLEDSAASKFDVLHLATHFVVKLGDTGGSRLYLGDRSTLSLAQIAGQDVRFDGVDLVTLSACETAVGGGKTSYGQEMESLSAQVQKQGALAVMATLWKVADKSTGALMSRFYENKAKGMNKAEALRQAQLALISGEVGVPGSKQLNWKHPFYWAPFVLMGNWR